MIKKFKRVKSYNEEDFDILIQFLARKRVFVTPGVMAEVSNMAMELKGDGFTRLVETNIDSLKRLGEFYVAKDVILEAPDFKKLGVTDTSILIAARKNKGEILTADHHLCSRCKTQGIQATHMMELQTLVEQFL
jgi:rRNA-processing protein FCF1